MKTVIAFVLGLFISVAHAANPTVAPAPAKIIGPMQIKIVAPTPASPNNIILTKDNTISINDVFYGETVANIAREAKILDSRTDSTDPIYLVINSPGGSIDAGLELIETLSSLKRPVKTISQWSVSMGFQTVQGLGERLIFKNGTLMSHKARGGFYGEFPGQLDSRYAYYLKRVMRMDELTVSRTNGKHTMQSYHSMIEPEFWCDGKDCLDQGMADRIITATCDKSLEGIKTVPVWQDIVYGHTVELKADYDVCPLNTYALKYSILIDGQPLFKDATPAPAVKQDPSTAYRFYDPYASMFSSSSSNDSSPHLTKEELYEIRKRTDEVMNKKKNKEVIRGY